MLILPPNYSLDERFFLYAITSLLAGLIPHPSGHCAASSSFPFLPAIIQSTKGIMAVKLPALTGGACGARTGRPK